MHAFSFKPALLRSARAYHLDASGLTEDGTSTQVDWADVADAAYVETVAKRMRFRRLDLTRKSDGVRVHISVTTWDADPPTDPNAIEFLFLVSAALTHLDAAQPGFEVTFGEHGKARLAMFAVGAFSLLAAVAMAALAVLAGISSDKWIAAAGPVLILAAFGGVIMHRNAFWQDPPKLSATLLANALKSHLDAPEGGS